ncbi:MAG: Ryanodine receptor Ryr [Clostridia bacterium]|nr:Ryanodine receptor Ryr [Clostridia bacterium]
MYIPKPQDTSGVALSQEILEMTEQIAKNTHENWAKNKIEDGWVYGKELDDDKKTHPCLIEYEKLSEEDKDYDRTTAMEAIKLLIKNGYKITKGV